VLATGEASVTERPKRFRRSDWATDDRLWNGHLDGERLGTDVTILFYSTDEIGKGPRLHVHDYPEIFVIRQGNALFTIGGRKIEATTGDVLVGPAGVPHKFVNLGPGLLETTDIHLSDKWIQTNLEDPEAVAN
jgi:mannose-6-phosphate isomerase-like protein (cupin superfamily)